MDWGGFRWIGWFIFDKINEMHEVMLDMTTVKISTLYLKAFKNYPKKTFLKINIYEDKKHENLLNF